MKAIIYCRVSTKEQAEQGYSLEGQEKDSRKFASDNGYEVDKVFVERGESAKTTDRTQLQKLIKYAVENKKTLSALIIWKYDRLARNLSDQTELVKNFCNLGIRVLSVTENNEENSVGRLMRNIIGSFAQYENDIKSERTTNGMKRAVEQGRWCWKAPVGYNNSKDNQNKPLLMPNNDAPFIIEAFELFATGLHKQADIVDILQKKGLKKISKNLMTTILRNPLYAGLIKNDWFSDYIDAIHSALISKDLFFKVQAILDGKKPSLVPKVRNHPDFPLRNFVRCPKCEQKLTGGWSTGRKGVRYGYYHCRTKGCSTSIKKAELDGNFYYYLLSFQPKENMLRFFEEVVLDVWKTRQSEQMLAERRVSEELQKIKEKNDRLFDLLMKGTIDDGTYKIKTEELKVEILSKQIEQNDLKMELNDIEGCLSYCRYVLTNLAKLWFSADLNLKQRFQTLIFPEKLYYDNGTFRTTATASIFKQLQCEMSRESYLVAPTGFEPVFDG